MEPERVPGSSYLAVLWMAGCAQWAMGDVEGDMAVPRRDDRQMSASEKTTDCPCRGHGEGYGRGSSPEDRG